MRAILIIGFVSLFYSSLLGQRVTVSEDINLRSDYMYDILGKVDDKILLYRDKGFNHVLQVFDENLWEKESIELNFEKKRVTALGLLSGESDFTFFYTYRRKGDQVLACRKFDADGSLLDTTTLTTTNSLLNYQKYFFAFSKNKRYASIFSFEKENAIKVFMFDTQKMEVTWSNIYAFDFAFIRRDFREFMVSDNGGGVIVFKREEFKIGKPDERIEAYYMASTQGLITQQIIPFGDKYIVDYGIEYDNTNEKFVIAGLYGDKFRSRADGYFMMVDGSLRYIPFRSDLFTELEKNSKRKVNFLEDYVVADIIVREDGGVLMVSEMERQFSRKSNMVEGRRQSFDMRAYVDYYNEDMVVTSIHPTGDLHWQRVLRKKQFSQDDGGFFSSFFAFKSPTELRLIFNDEIRQDNTVSEYIINPIGDNERNIVMNTEYQKLKLRFREAIQISPRDFIVPSERNSKFNLVKVSF
ncbi:hypothetical protein [Portibacter lacus]|uniref:Uncharacterized protein n=1 Tax=Portibacter lacus TaxID=1099794 RepID=A0AA37SUE1_9BACT|nr:hypothetical protein [Portibacter lacus]GLR18981.1 hypothetical protein GCM10007940_35970 [Portibacter lacus]